MKNLVALLCVISALVGSVFSYRCMSGVSYNSTTCNVSEIECLAAGCMTVCQYFYIVPKDDPTPNGKLCPSAYCTDTVEECKGHHMVECTGAMDRCFEYRAEVIIFGGTSKKLSVKGCITGAACKINFDSCIAITEKKRTLLNCNAPSIKLSELMNKPSIY
ncbi:uncharacterized protein LOC143768717 isoform X2 [Ranitomeya variabilis]|uniref:uncharacterized protein LOC143768717 isoform X2 n=1 Tax=Ranitomeya variabilis TaxID=490064 RepID=UPI004056C3FE